MEALLAIGSEAPPRGRLASRLDGFGLVCAADSGLDLLAAWGVEPDLVVGDMDSLSSLDLLSAYPRAEILRFPRAKDESDTELGLRILHERGAARVVIAGGGGGRIDHLLAIRALFERPLPPAEWHAARESIYLVAEGRRLEFQAAEGETVSVFPLSSGAEGMRSSGLRWPLEGLRWGPGDFGLSNEAAGGGVLVEAGRGSLLVVREMRD